MKELQSNASICNIASSVDAFLRSAYADRAWHRCGTHQVQLWARSRRKRGAHDANGLELLAAFTTVALMENSEAGR